MREENLRAPVTAEFGLYKHLYEKDPNDRKLRNSLRYLFFHPTQLLKILWNTVWVRKSELDWYDVKDAKRRLAACEYEHTMFSQEVDLFALKLLMLFSGIMLVASAAFSPVLSFLSFIVLARSLYLSSGAETRKAR